MPQDPTRVSPSAVWRWHSGAFFLQSLMDQDQDGSTAAGAAQFQPYHECPVVCRQDLEEASGLTELRQLGHWTATHPDSCYCHSARTTAHWRLRRVSKLARGASSQRETSKRHDMIAGQGWLDGMRLWRGETGPGGRLASRTWTSIGASCEATEWLP